MLVATQFNSIFFTSTIGGTKGAGFVLRPRANEPPVAATWWLATTSYQDFAYNFNGFETHLLLKITFLSSESGEFSRKVLQIIVVDERQPPINFV